jgi:hypothetical protein
MLEDCNRQMTLVNGGERDKSSTGFEIAGYAMRFGQQTILAITDEIASNRPCQAGILARTLFELGARVRWASLRMDGWSRLLVYWALEHRKTAQAALDSGLFEFARKDLEGVVARYEESPLPKTEACPGDMLSVLRQIDEDCCGDEHCERPGQEKVPYTGYRDLCRASHANMSLCGGGIPSGAIARVVGTNVVYATWHLVEAAYRLMGKEDVGQLMVPLELQKVAQSLNWE